MMSWDELNERQQKYLQVIYEVDQDQEQYERSMWTRGGTPRKASVWRWMDYATLDGGDTQLKSRLRSNKLINEGTGSTFEALERRGLIKCRYSYKTRDGIPVLMAPGESILAVQITPAGRKLVREATGEKPVRMVPGTLQEWHWIALAKAYKARPQGLKSEVTGRYGNIGWGTWLRLREYKAGDLVKEHEVRRGKRPDGWYYTDYYIRLTPFGEQYYRDNWQRYREMYPDVDAPEP